MWLSQIGNPDGSITVVAREGGQAYAVRGARSTYDLVIDCIRSGSADLAAYVATLGRGPAVDLVAALEEGRVLAPITHPDPAHLHLTGTGLTHLGSAATRDGMHQKAGAADETLTDSMKMFRMGLEGGKPVTLPGVQPEWFYKGNGTQAVAPGAALVSPAFARDGGEEPEIAGIYVIGP
ncbi:MAG: FAH family protein, partial [Rhizobacter sp.]|nr:FAH family protein [Rhizobacter sp.]